MTNLVFLATMMLPIYLGWLLVLIPVVFLILTPAMALSMALLSLAQGLRVFFARQIHPVNFPIIDNGTPLIDFSSNFPGLHLLRSDLLANHKMLGRLKIGQMLMSAQDSLLKKYSLLILECHRSNANETFRQNRYIGQISRLNPKFTKQMKIAEHVRLDLDFANSGQNTGGAINVTLADQFGNPLDLGTRDTRTTNWLGQLVDDKSSLEIFRNRQTLAVALRSAGFSNNPLQWWHWSYGDKSWCANTKAIAAIYGNIESAVI